MRGCHCPEHETARTYNRRYLKNYRGHHLNCDCIGGRCPRIPIEQAIASGLTATRVIARTGCDYPTYRAILDRMARVA